MKDSAITHYEVYCLEGRRWILHARFRRDERDTAVEEARAVERTMGAIVKVVREIYYPGTNSCEESLIYGSNRSDDDHPTAHHAPRRDMGGGGYGGRMDDYPSFDVGHGQPGRGGRGATGARIPAPQAMGLMLKLSLIVITAIAVAGVVTALISSLAPKLAAAGVVTSQEQMSGILFGAFVTTFLITAVPLSLGFLHDNAGAIRKMRPAPAPAPMRPMPRPQPKKAAKPETKPEEPKPEEKKAEEEDKQLEPETTPEPQPEPEAEKGVETTEKPAEPPAGRHPEFERYKLEMMKFLGGVVTVIKSIKPQLDAYNKFGIDLMLAGGVEVLGDRNDLESDTRRDLLAETIQVMGTKPTMARTFADKYEEYMMEPRYLPMVRAGREAMEGYLDGEGNPTAGIPAVLNAWNRPQGSGGAQPKILTIIFTDMVGSTDMTQERGDWGAQDIVRRHNSIVRSALSQYGGKEIKHTGDGIMASFPSTADGVEACIKIQRDVARHNRTSPDLPLHLRIGINAGEPIQEEDDLFGSTVQLSARVCAKCDTDKILCTNIVRELSQGRNIAFSSIGAHALKGFKEPITLYEVDWAEAASSAPPPNEGRTGPAAANLSAGADAKTAVTWPGYGSAETTPAPPSGKRTV